MLLQCLAANNSAQVRRPIFAAEYELTNVFERCLNVHVLGLAEIAALLNVTMNVNFGTMLLQQLKINLFSEM